MADVCDICTTFFNQFRFATVKNPDLPNENEEDEGNGVSKYYNQTGRDNSTDIVIEAEQREACSAL